MGLSSFKFVQWAPKKPIFSAPESNRMRFGRSRSSKVDDFGTNRKRVYDFVGHCNYGSILHRFWDTAIYFLPRNALVHSAVLRLHVVRLSVCLSVTFVDQDHIGWKTWKLIARTLSPTPSLFVAERPSTYSQGNVGKFGGDYGWGGVLENKSDNISETPKDRGKVTMESL